MPSGKLMVGSVIEFVGNPRPAPPEVEDIVIDGSPDYFARIPDDHFFEIVERRSSPSLAAAFGPVLVSRRNNRAAVDVGGGTASLAHLVPTDCELTRRSSEIRLGFTDPGLGPVDAPVTDLRLFDPDGSVRGPVARSVGLRLQNRSRVVLAVGLSRAFQAGRDDHPRHWLQVNNLHFEDYFDDHPSFRL